MRAVFLIIIAVFLFAKESFYTIQLASGVSKEKILNLYEKYKYKIKNLRVEKIGNFYTIRVGFYKNYQKAKQEYKILKKCFDKALLRKGYFIKKRVIVSNEHVEKNENKILKDKALVDLIIQTYLANGEVSKLSSFLKNVVKNYPNEKYLSLYAKVLLWDKHPMEAMNLYYELFLKYKKKKYAQKAFKLAYWFKEYNLALKLLPYVKASKEQKIVLYNKLGYINKLIALLKKSSSKKDLQKLAQIYYIIGDLKDSLKTLNKIKKMYGLTPKYAHLMANVYFAKKDFLKAQRILKRYFSKANNFSFWEDFFTLSVMVDDKKSAFLAAKKLINDPKKTYKIDAYLFLSNYLFLKEPKKALEYAKEGWQKFKEDVFFINMLNLYYSLGQYKKVIKLYPLNPNLIDNSESLFYVYLDSLYRVNPKKAKKYALIYLSSTYSPLIFNLYFQEEVNSQNKKEIQKVLRKFKNYESVLPEVFINAYLFLENGDKALFLYKKYSVDNLFLYSNILDLCGKHQEAMFIKRKLFEELKSEKYFDRTELERFLNLAIYFYTMPKIEYLFKKYKSHLPKKIWRMLYVNALLYHNRIELAKNLKYSNYEPWMLLNFALYEKNQYLMRKLLKKYVNVLPIRDRVSALDFVGDKGKALNYAFKGLNEDNYDYFLYKQFRDIVLEVKSYFRENPQYIVSNDYNAFLNDMEVFFKDIEGFDIKAKFVYKRINFKNSNILINTKNNVLEKFEISKKIKRMILGVCVKKISKLNYNTSYGMWIDYKFSNMFSLFFKYFKKDTTDENVYELLNGFKSGEKIDFTFNLNHRISIVQSNEFSDIFFDSKKVGKKKYNDLTFILRIREAYPNFKVYSRVYNLNYSNTEKISSEHFLTPTKIVPDDDYGFGVGLSFGEEQKESLVRIFRPFADIYLQTSKIASFSYNINFGIGGGMFNKDNLSFGVSFSNTLSNNPYILFDLIYKRWF